MNKTGWQATTGICFAGFLITAAAAWNNGRTINVMNEQLREARKATEEPIECPEPARHIDGSAYVDTLISNEISKAGFRCIRGQLFKIESNKWLQVGECQELSERMLNNRNAPTLDTSGK